jgi:hypothetical protein
MNKFTTDEEKFLLDLSLSIIQGKFTTISEVSEELINYRKQNINEEEQFDEEKYLLDLATQNEKPIMIHQKIEIENEKIESQLIDEMDEIRESIFYEEKKEDEENENDEESNLSSIDEKNDEEKK